MIAWLAVARGEVAFEAPPADAVETVVVVTGADGGPAAGETVRVVHRPGLAGSREIAVGITDGRGRVRWTPEGGGLTRLRAGEQEIELEVVRAEVPAVTAGLAAVLAAVGLGCAGVGLWRRP